MNKRSIGLVWAACVLAGCNSVVAPFDYRRPLDRLRTGVVETEFFPPGARRAGDVLLDTNTATENLGSIAYGAPDDPEVQAVIALARRPLGTFQGATARRVAAAAGIGARLPLWSVARLDLVLVDGTQRELSNYRLVSELLAPRTGDTASFPEITKHYDFLRAAVLVETRRLAQHGMGWSDSQVTLCTRVIDARVLELRIVIAPEVRATAAAACATMSGPGTVFGRPATLQASLMGDTITLIASFDRPEIVASQRMPLAAHNAFRDDSVLLVVTNDQPASPRVNLSFGPIRGGN